MKKFQINPNYEQIQQLYQTNPFKPVSANTKNPETPSPETIYRLNQKTN